MKFPDVLTVVALDSDTGSPVDNVAVILRLFAERKNDYYVGPAITNTRGQAQFTREECERGIRRAQEMFVMDYVGSLQTCRPILEVSLHPAERITTMLEQYKSSPDFWGQAFNDPDHLLAALWSVRNADYEEARVSVTEAQALANPQATIQLTKRRRAQRSTEGD